MHTKTTEEAARDVEQTRTEARRALKNVGEVWSGRNAVASAWRTTKGGYLRTQDKVVNKVAVADDTIRTNVYASVGIALGLGGILGFFLTKKPRRKSRNC
jgi:ElaB/YqjD/DUF883 family membrane-anchored ribosome-binding protein